MTLLVVALIACVGCPTSGGPQAGGHPASGVTTLAPGSYTPWAPAAGRPGDTASSPRSTDRIEFLRKVDRLLVGQRIQLLARAVAADGSPLGHRIEWRASSSSYVSLAADGRITGITPGRVTIMALAGDRVASFELEVVPNVVGSLSLTPDYEVTRVGEEVSFEFRVLDPDRVPIQGIQPSWELPSGLDASISDEGVFVARLPGLHTIVAAVGDRKAIATVRVAPR